jgi:hypothetical protein
MKFTILFLSLTFLFVQIESLAIKDKNDNSSLDVITRNMVATKTREFLFRNRPKDFLSDPKFSPSIIENNIQSKPITNSLSNSNTFKIMNSLTTTTKMILSTHHYTETTLPIPGNYKTSHSSVTTTSSPVLTPKKSKLNYYYLENYFLPTRNFLLASKYVKTSTPLYFLNKFHLTDYVEEMRDDWTDGRYESKTFKNDFDDFYGNY